MDIVSHALWGGAAFGRKNKKNFLLALLFGALPDLLSFGVYFVHRLVLDWNITHWAPYHSHPNDAPVYLHVLYNLTHSLVIFAVVFGVVWLINKSPFWPIAAWGLHILVDIPSHSFAYFPTPFLWPISNFKINGIGWTHPIIFIPNLILLGFTYGYLILKYSRIKSKNKTKRFIIFDFDGTIVDSCQAILEAFNKLAPKLGFSNLSLEEERNLGNLSSREVFFKKFKIPKWKMPFVLFKARRMLAGKSSEILLYKGIDRIIGRIKKQGNIIGIVSSSPKSLINNLLEKNLLWDKIDYIEGGLGLFSKDKKINKVIKKSGVKKRNVFYIGDETRDIEAARKAGVKIISVTWGLNSEKILKKYKPDFLARKPKELREILMKNGN